MAFSLDSPDAAWNFEIKQEPKELYMSKHLYVTIDCDHPANFTAELSPFFESLKRQEGFPFDIVTESASESSSAKDRRLLTLLFELAPKHPGNLIFVPGPLTFISNEKNSEERRTVLLPATSVNCIASNYSALELEGLLPLNPELAIQMSRENRKRVFEDQKYLELEREKNWQLFIEHQVAWMIVTLLLMGIGLGIFFYWVFIQYDLIVEHKDTGQKPVNLLALVSDYLRDQDMDLPLRWQKLSYLFREALGRLEGTSLLHKTTPELEEVIKSASYLPEDEKLRLEQLFSRLESIEYAQAPSTLEEWRIDCQNFITWVKKRLS